MKKVEVGTLDENELFEHRGTIYEVLYKTDYCVRCQYPNDKYRYGDMWEYLYTEFSLWTKVNKFMKTLVFDVMLDGRFIHTFRYQYCPLFPIDEQELEKFVTDRLPTLKGKDFKIVF